MRENISSNEYVCVRWVSNDHIGLYHGVLLNDNHYEGLETFEVVSVGEFAEFISIFGYSAISKTLDSKSQAIFYQLCLNFIESYPEQFAHIRKDV